MIEPRVAGKALTVGARVRDEFLGTGTVVEIIDLLFCGSAYVIQFDETPPFDYNCGFNPCLRFAGSLEEIEQ